MTHPFMSKFLKNFEFILTELTEVTRRQPSWDDIAGMVM